MPTFITYASYSRHGLQGLLRKPEDRQAAIQALLDKVGGKVVSLYMVTGRCDLVMVTELPEGQDAVAVGMAVAASGAAENIETVRAWSSSEFVDIAKKADGLTGAYTPPGG